MDRSSYSLLAKNNQKLARDEKVIREALDFVDSMRDLGVKPKKYDLSPALQRRRSKMRLVHIAT